MIYGHHLIVVAWHGTQCVNPLAYGCHVSLFGKCCTFKNMPVKSTIDHILCTIYLKYILSCISEECVHFMFNREYSHSHSFFAILLPTTNKSKKSLLAVWVLLFLLLLSRYTFPSKRMNAI